MSRREHVFQIGEGYESQTLTVTRKGLEFNWAFLSWEVIDAVRRRIEGKDPIHPNDVLEKIPYEG